MHTGLQQQQQLLSDSFHSSCGATSSNGKDELLRMYIHVFQHHNNPLVSIPGS